MVADRGRATPEVRPRSGDTSGVHHTVYWRQLEQRTFLGERSQSLRTGCENLRLAVVSAAAKICVTPSRLRYYLSSTQKRLTRLVRPMPRRAGTVTRGARKQQTLYQSQEMETS